MALTIPLIMLSQYAITGVGPFNLISSKLPVSRKLTRASDFLARKNNYIIVKLNVDYNYVIENNMCITCL